MSESRREMQHTPGPWTAVPRGGVLAADGLLVAHCVQPYARAVSTGIEADREVVEGMNANARLMAAAPDMAEALRLVVLTSNECAGECLHSRCLALRGARFALQKAGVLP